MISVNSKILVTCNLQQKDYIEIEGIKLQMANLFETNYREKSPVIAIAEQSKGEITKGDVLICHHNHFYQPSPYWIENDLYSIPYNHTIFGIVKQDKIQPVCGNLFVEIVEKPTVIPLPPDEIEYYIDRYLVNDGGATSYKKGTTIFTKPFSGYIIMYIINGIEHRINKVNSEMIIGYM